MTLKHSRPHHRSDANKMKPSQRWIAPTHSAARRFRDIGTMAFLCFLTACGGGGSGNAGTAEGGAAAITLSADVFPLAVGNTKTWRVTAGPLTGQIHTERVTDTVQIDGRSAFVVRDENRGTDYLVRTATGVTSVAGAESDPLTAAAGPTEQVTFGQTVGETRVTVDRTVAIDYDRDGRVDSVDLRAEHTFLGYETVSIAAGTFAGAAHVRTQIRTVTRYAGKVGAVTVVAIADEWFAPGLGAIRSTVAYTTNGVAAGNEIEELVAYGVGNQRSDNAAPSLLSLTPATASFVEPEVPFVLNFSEKLDPWTRDTSAGIGLFNAQGTAIGVAREWSQNGQDLLLRPTTALADGVYELRIGSALTDLSNNAAAPVTRVFTVDKTRPQVVSTLPNARAEDVALTGELVLKYSEPLANPGNAALSVQVSSFFETITLPATIRGNDLVATVTVPLKRNTEYFLSVLVGPADAAGNAAAYFPGLSFRTDPGPLARPTALTSEGEVTSLAIGDVDGDGRADLVFAANKGFSSDNYFIAVRFQQVDGRYAAPVRVHAQAASYVCEVSSITVADVDGDGKPDIAVACQQQVFVLRQQADRSFVAETVAKGVPSRRIRALDLDGDGRSEIVIGDFKAFQFFKRSPTGVWTSVLSVDGSTSYIIDWRLVDLNADGKLDLVWLHFRRDENGYSLGYIVSSALRQGSSFGPTRSNQFGVDTDRPIGLAVGDLNGDGRPDLAFTLEQPKGGVSISKLGVIYQSAAGGFTDLTLHDAYYAASSIEIADVNGDGRADVLVSHDAGRVLGVHLQSASGTLDAERRAETSYASYSTRDIIVALDLNADGLKDIVVGGDVLLAKPVAGPWPAAAPARVQATQVKTDLAQARNLASAAGGDAQGRRGFWPIARPARSLSSTDTTTR
jgi:Bacterial Ig-like domain/FG-GAP-like repeat